MHESQAMSPEPTFSGRDAPSPALIDACVHCGFCLPTCPTYLLRGEEMDSPRGRIYLMKAGVEGRAEMTASFVRHFDSCLGCLACVTACPSGVEYGPLIERTRAQIERHYPRPAGDRWFRKLLMSIVPYPFRLRFALAPLVLFGGLVRSVARGGAASGGSTGGYTKQDPPYTGAVPDPPYEGANAPGSDRVGRVLLFRPALLQRVRAALALSPPVTWRSLFARTPEHTPSVGPARMKVAVLTGCVQRLTFARVNEATVRVLSAEGCAVAAPAAQACCGALSLHSGHIDDARRFARHNIEVFEASGAERVAVNAAGCGSAMKDYGELFADDPAWAARAHAFSEKVRDVSQLLVELGSARAPRHPIAARVVYHDACHLAHGQGIRAEPRSLLQAIPGVEVVTPAESDICCGSAGIYNLVQPEAASELGERKARHIASLSPDMIATANPGCILQIAASGRRLGHDWPIFHPIELIDASIRGVDPRT